MFSYLRQTNHVRSPNAYFFKNKIMLNKTFHYNFYCCFHTNENLPVYTILTITLAKWSNSVSICGWTEKCKSAFCCFFFFLLAPTALFIFISLKPIIRLYFTWNGERDLMYGRNCS